MEIAQEGGESVISERAAEYVSRKTWAALVAKYRNHGCDDIAKLARRILEGKNKLHDIVARVTGGLLGMFGVSRIERLFVQEVVRSIPLPVDGKLAVAARGLQIAGIYMCLAGSQNISGCACLQDVLKTEEIGGLKILMQAAVEDWAHIPERTSQGA